MRTCENFRYDYVLHTLHIYFPCSCSILLKIKLFQRLICRSKFSHHIAGCGDRYSRDISKYLERVREMRLYQVYRVCGSTNT